MIQEAINNTVIDVVYDNEQIYHVLEPNLDGIRGISPSQFMIRDTIKKAKEVLQNLDCYKITEFENELKNN